MFARSTYIAVTAATLALLPVAVRAADTSGSKFLQAVRESKGSEVEAMLNANGSTVINTRSITNGETAIHIVVRRGDVDYARYLLARGARPNVRDNAGDAPLVIAAGIGRVDLADVLLKNGAGINFGNASGETALLRAVQKRDPDMVQALLDAGADPDQVDYLAGKSARDLAHADNRSPAIARLIDDRPRKKPRAVAGPKL